jgi:hypothetical protein
VAMEELRTVTGVNTLVDFNRIWHELVEEGWQFVSTVSTEDEGQVLVFKRDTTGLGNTGLI